MMKKWLKILGITFISIFLILLLLPFAFKGKILKIARETASESLYATVHFDDDLSVSLIKNFPNLHVGINNLQIIGIDSFAKDTLFQSKNIKLSIDISSILSDDKPITLRKIALEDPKIFVHVLKSGRANYDITKEDTTEMQDTSAPIALKLKQLKIRNAHIHYKDVSMGVDFISGGSDFDGKGSFEGDIFTLASHYHARYMSLNYDKMNLMSKAVFDLKSDVKIDLNSMHISFTPLQAKLNQLPLNMNGWIQMNEENMDMDLKVDVPSSEFKDLLSAVPGFFTKDFEQVKTAGSMKLNVALKGIMDDQRTPQTKIDLLVKNAQFQYPDLPKAVSGINIDFHLTNEDGNPDHTVVNLKEFNLKLGNDPLSMALYATNPISHPYAKGFVQAQVDLDAWKDMMPLEEGVKLKGKVEAALTFDGHYAEVEAQKIKDLKVEGTIGLNQFLYQAPGVLTTQINTFKLTANPKHFTLAPTSIQYGSSTVTITEGKIENILGFVLHHELLHGVLKINANKIDLNEWMPAENPQTESTEEDTSALSAPHIPEKIDFVFQGAIGELIYDAYHLKQCEAKIAIKEGMVFVNPIKATIWGSTLNFNTDYAFLEGGKPEINAQFSLMNFIPNKVGSEVKLLQQYAPILNDFSAPININMNLSTALTESLSIQFDQLNAQGLIAATQAQYLKSPQWLTQVFEQLKWQKDKMSEVKIKPGKAQFEIHEGKLSLKDSIALDIYEGSRMSFIGSIDLEQKLDFKGYFYTQGKSIPMSIMGTATKPQLRIEWKQLGLQVVEEYKEKAVAEIKKEANQAVDKALQEAEAKAEQLKREAKIQADKIREEGKRLSEETRKETDKNVDNLLNKTKEEIQFLMDKAKNPLEKLAAEKAGKKLQDEADKKAKKLKEEGYAKAQKLENESNSKADALERETDSKAQKLIDDAKTQQQRKLK
jgi:hypothetical protein